ncbi:sushi domain-containing protein 2 [Phycodurus eques]|uniref:sushi domain-containing protein 2 n=1 Tax=Phycodurus eques TaxID=693459 RepID=UPI002ACE6A38|nr:sushi domain-containing protein 2 [Phycodurus eques]
MAGYDTIGGFAPFSPKVDTRTAVAVLLLLLPSVGGTLGESCQGKCGQSLGRCSCRATCASLARCCPDYKEFCVEFSPQSGSILGGTDFLVLHATFNRSDLIVCKFDDGVTTTGYVDEAEGGHCISPLLYQSGWVPVRVSSNHGIAYDRVGSWLAVHTGKLDAKLKAHLVNSTKWQYYGTPQVGGSLEMTWNTSLVRARGVNVELWGYRETGKPYSDRWRAEWKFLYSLAEDAANNGSFAFVPQPSADFSSWEVGALRVSSSTNPRGLWNVEAAWSEDHALAWHLERKFRNDSGAWALGKCLAWDRLENDLPDFLDEIVDCPCTLAQARADTGRFHTDYGCDIERGSVCTYHPGSVHCVRAIQASPRYAAGQQCCYDGSGVQVLTADSVGGSTPDRAHDWGSPPYGRPPRVPGQSHWLYDVLSFYYCCLWSDNCRYYFKRRPSSDCRRYRPPSSAVVFGDPHFITFDGVRYSFNGKGEYNLLTCPGKRLTIQGRTEPVDGNATKLTSVAMKEASSDVIEVRLVAGDDGLQVLRNQKQLLFNEQSWMDLDGVFVFSPSAPNVTVMFPSGAGVEVRLRDGTVTATVLLPEEFHNATRGLLGNANGVAGDDLVPARAGSNATRGLLGNANGVAGDDLVPARAGSNAEDVFNFGASWAVSNESALFTYDSKYLLDTYYNSPRHDPDFIPAFSVPENPDDPLYDVASDVCSGAGSQFCRYDILVGRSPDLGKATKVSFQSHASLVEDLKPVVSCGRLAPPTDGRKEGTAYLQGSTVRLLCDDGFAAEGPTERTCLADGTWSGGDTVCVPYAPSNKAAVIAGSVVGVLLAAALITAGLVFWAKKRKRSSRLSRDLSSSFGRVEFTDE